MHPLHNSCYQEVWLLVHIATGEIRARVAHPATLMVIAGAQKVQKDALALVAHRARSPMAKLRFLGRLELALGLVRGLAPAVYLLEPRTPQSRLPSTFGPPIVHQRS